jgi:pectinesterase
VQSRNSAGKGGYVFADCRLTAVPEVKRNWLARIETVRFPASQVTFIRCAMGAHIPAAGWLTTGTNTDALRFEEFASMDLTGKELDVSQRHAASKQLSASEAAAQGDVAKFLSGKDGWNPKGK